MVGMDGVSPGVSGCWIPRLVFQPPYNQSVRRPCDGSGRSKQLVKTHVVNKTDVKEINFECRRRNLLPFCFL